MKATFLGTGTSTGIPMVGCDCPVCRSSDPRNRRRRASVLIEHEGRTWLIDCGPDFRSQALDARIDLLEAVLITHAHSDHLLGLDDLRPLSWKRSLDVYCDERTDRRIRELFPYFFFEGPSKNSRPQLTMRRFQPGVKFAAAGLTFVPVPIVHGDEIIVGFRIGDFAYLTDCNGIPDSSRPMLKNLDTLVLGALRSKPHPTHFSLDEAVAAARTVGARRTFFTHFSHDVDHATWAATLPEGYAPAYDGLTLEF